MIHLLILTRQVSICIGVEGHDPCVYIQIPGCTDDFACNYSDIAEVDDGSCLYDDTCGECGGLWT